MNNKYGKRVIITGASSGIGMACADLLARNGFSVYGGSRHGCREIKYNSGFIRSLVIDVTDDESVKNAVDKVVDELGGVDILINAAGNGICGAIEECSAKDAYNQMNTNYFGVIRMIGAVMPIMREQRNGLIINIGSVGGLFSIPFQTCYSSSKYALEALTEGLRIEAAPFGIKAALVEPGDIKTGFTAARKYAERATDSCYGERFKNAIAQMEYDEQNGDSPDTIAKAVMRVIGKKNPPVRLVVGVKYKLFAFLKRILPAKTVGFLLEMMYPKSDIRKKNNRIGK